MIFTLSDRALLLRPLAQASLAFPSWLSNPEALTLRSYQLTHRLFRLYLNQRFVTDFGRRTLSECSCRKADSSENEQCLIIKDLWRLLAEKSAEHSRSAGRAGFLKIDCLLNAMPRSVTNLHRAGRSASPKLCSLEWNKRDVAPRTRRHAGALEKARN